MAKTTTSLFPAKHRWLISLRMALPSILVLFLFLPMEARAKPRKSMPQNTLSGGKTQHIEKELKVRGQTRTLSMMLVLKNKKDSIDFINIRKNFGEEILSTEY